MSRAMTMVEVIISMVLLSMLLAGVLSAVELSARTQHSTAVIITGRTLAADLLEEICDAAYADPVNANEFGPGADEDASDRSTFDDVDDYHNWSESPPAAADGALVTGASAWTRNVSVRWVDPLDPQTSAFGESGAKLITVEAVRAGVIYASVSRVRTRGWDQAAIGN